MQCSSRRSFLPPDGRQERMLHTEYDSIAQDHTVRVCTRCRRDDGLETIFPSCYSPKSQLWCPSFIILVASLAQEASLQRLSQLLGKSRPGASACGDVETLCRVACTWRRQRHAPKIVVPICLWLYSEPRGCSR